MPAKKTTSRKPSGIARVREKLQKAIAAPTRTEANALLDDCLALLDGLTPEKRKRTPAPEPTLRCLCGCGGLASYPSDFYSPECRQRKLGW